ncbi:Nn.00g046610.m01.CDS01 [Neocucurbitaria sp. VM-36]
MVRQFSFLPSDYRATRPDGRTLRYSHWRRYNTFYGLAFTTTLATTLLLAEVYQWRVTGYIFILANRFPGSVALVVQLLAAFFGLLHVAVICKLINYALRLRLNKVSVSLDMLRTWVDMSIPRVDWDLPLRFFFPVLFVVFLSLVPAALWAGSMTPSVSRTSSRGMLLIPSYEDVSMIREYPMMIGSAGPSLRTQKGFFTYSVGQQQSGQLLSTAASASSTGIGPHVHRKLDNTQFSYRGRSYGVGAPVGLMDQGITSDSSVAGYIYQEEGYLANVTCIYNTTSNFALSGPVNEWIYAAAGSLPDSVDGSEYSNYIGHDGKAIVAIGVSFSEKSPRRYLAITAGEAYSYLNNTQCEFDFTPTLFNVTVDCGNLNITVKPAATMTDFNPQRNITRTVVRQFELMSNDMTNLYVSLLGEAFNSSIAAYKMSRTSASRNPFTEEEATLAGLTSSITAMADDMLVAYASAQLMVGRMFTQQPAKVYVYALQFGQPGYIYAIFSLNLLIMFAVVFEAVRTVGWSSLGRFNYLDPRDLIIAASRGGAETAAAADDIMDARDRKKARHVWLLSDPDEGNGSLVVNVKGDQSGHVRIVVAGADVRESKMEKEKCDMYASDEKKSSFSFVDEEFGKGIPKKLRMGIFGFM